jgi:hypothetical protein
MKKIILFTALMAFVAGSSIAVTTAYSNENSIEVASGGTEGDTKKDDKEAKKADDKDKKASADKTKDCASTKQCCKKSTKSCDDKKKKEKE